MYSVVIAAEAGGSVQNITVLLGQQGKQNAESASSFCSKWFSSAAPMRCNVGLSGVPPSCAVRRDKILPGSGSDRLPSADNHRIRHLSVSVLLEMLRI